MPLTTTTIRTDLKARLIAAALVPAGHVFDSRIIPIEGDGAEFPLLIIESMGHDDDNLSVGLPHWKRLERVTIQGAAEAASEAALAAALDALKDSVLNALLLDSEWIKKFEKIVKIETDFTAIYKADRLRGGVIITLSLQYRYQPVPVAEDTLSKVHIDYELHPGATPETVEATQDLTLAAP